MKKDYEKRDANIAIIQQDTKSLHGLFLSTIISFVAPSTY